MTFKSFILSIKPVLNISGLESAAAIPAKSLHKYLMGAADLKAHHKARLLSTICQTFGSITIDDWTITSEFSEFVAVKNIPDRQIKIVETANSFEYIAEQWHRLYDGYDFITQFFDDEI